LAYEKLVPTLSIKEISIYAAADETERWNDNRCISNNLWQAGGIRVGKNDWFQELYSIIYRLFQKVTK
jgi:hypothetical protein